MNTICIPIWIMYAFPIACGLVMYFMGLYRGWTLWGEK